MFLKGWLTVFFWGGGGGGSRLDCVHGVQSNMFIYLYSTPPCPFSDKRWLFPGFMKPLPNTGWAQIGQLVQCVVIG